MTARVIVLADYRRPAPEPIHIGNPLAVVWVALSVAATAVLLISAAWWIAGGVL